MKSNRKFWIGLIVIITVSIGVAFSAPISELFRGIVAIPAVGALSAALFQLIRDNATHQRNIEIQRDQQLFNLGATSHMANTVFDKHVEFCEEYLSEVDRLVVTLSREGPTQNAVQHAANLYTLRVKYTAWITPEIEGKLKPFEKAVSDIGLKYRLASVTAENDQNLKGKRSEAIEEMFDIFEKLFDINSKDEDATIIAVKSRIREILQINELVKIREYLIQRAANIKKS